MKKQLYFSTILAALLSLQGIAQTKNVVTGIVKDDKGKPLTAVSVALLKAILILLLIDFLIQAVIRENACLFS